MIIGLNLLDWKVLANPTHVYSQYDPGSFLHAFPGPKSVEISCLADSGAWGLLRPRLVTIYGEDDQSTRVRTAPGHISTYDLNNLYVCLHSLHCLYPLFAVCSVIKSMLHGAPDLRLQVLSWEGLGHAHLTETNTESRNTLEF